MKVKKAIPALVCAAMICIIFLLGSFQPVKRTAPENTTPLFDVGVEFMDNTPVFNISGLDTVGCDIRVSDGAETVWQKSIGCRESRNVLYGGQPLKSNTDYTYTVEKIIDRQSYSKSGNFRTGLIHDEDWHAEFISTPDCMAPVFRKEFNVTAEVKHATVNFAGLGYGYLSVNGQCLSSYMEQPFTHFQQKVLYQTFDITDKLIEGVNVFTVELGGGFLNIGAVYCNLEVAPWIDFPKFILNAEIVTNAATTRVVSDTNWKYAPSATVRNSVYFGEKLDGRLASDDFKQPAFDDSSWQNAIPQQNKNVGTLVMQQLERSDVIKEHKVKVAYHDSVGQRMILSSDVVLAGNLKLVAKGRKGDVLIIRYGEKLALDGKSVLSGFMYDIPVPPEGELQIDEYVFGGGDYETFIPKFSYKGYKYVQIDGPAEIDLDASRLLEIHNNVSSASDFETSNTLINTINDNMRRTLMNNFQNVPTDTPFYEKNGWTGDMNLACMSALYNFDLKNFFRKWIGDMGDSMDAYGMIYEIAPSNQYNWVSPELKSVWTSAYILCANSVYEFYGDGALIEREYANLKRFAEKMLEYLRTNDYVVPYREVCLGDWASPFYTERPIALSSVPNEGAQHYEMAYFYKAIETMRDLALKFGKNADAALFGLECDKIKTAFNDQFYDAENGLYTSGKWFDVYCKGRTLYRQAINAIALDFGLVPKQHVQSVLENLVNDIREKNDHLDTGAQGTHAIFLALDRHDQSELAYKIATQTTYPSYGYQILNGATTMWESWELDCRSNDHYLFGTVVEWFAKDIGGITNKKNGFSEVLISPNLYGDLTYVNYSLRTMDGVISAKLNKTNNNLIYEITVPKNVNAEIILHGKELSLDTHGTVINDSTYENGQYRFYVNEGVYHFTTTRL